jgi:hypothetical protein
MQIAKAMKRWLLVIPGCLLLSAVTWGQSWGPRASVKVVFGAPVRYAPVVQRWDDRRWDRDREWRERERREHEWRERERREDWRRYHRREERHEHRPYYRGY